nr:MobA/MobL family protein [Acidithiobacillus ferruginosus]
MAIYHASTKPIARSAGRSAVAAAAYRAGVELVDARTGLVHDYTRKGGVELTEILTPDGLGVERNALWNAAELAEKRKDARTAREWIVALPAELDAGQRTELAHDFAQALVERYGVAADLAIHAPDREGDNRNHHAHLLTTTRQVSRAPDGGLVLGAKAHIELSDKARRERGLGAAADEVKAVRELWEHTANAALERAGVDARIDARSLQAQGVDQEATQHLGPVASEMERRGKESDRGDGNREVSVNNEERARLSAEIIDLQAARERRERREAARREFEASHRDARPDVVLTARIVAHRVAELAMLEQLDIRCRWN